MLIRIFFTQFFFLIFFSGVGQGKLPTLNSSPNAIHLRIRILSYLCFRQGKKNIQMQGNTQKAAKAEKDCPLLALESVGLVTI